MSDNSLTRMDETLKAHTASHEGIEESIISILMEGSDTSGMERALYFQIISLPKHGQLIDPQSGLVIQAGEVLNQTDPYPWHGVIINYKGDSNFFTHPPKLDGMSSSQQHDDSFEFSVMAPQQNKVLVGRSVPVQTNVTVVNVNDPPLLKVPSAVQKLQKFSSLNWDSECHSSKNRDDDDGDSDDNDQQCSNVNRIEGISVYDPDRGIDFARINIKSTFGIISLNQKHLSKAEFASCSRRSRSGSNWNCFGAGIGDREMTFISRLTHLNSLLSTFEYESIIEGNDNITFTIYDGIGGDCLSEDEHVKKYKQLNITSPYTIYNPSTSVGDGTPNINQSCVKIEKTVFINVIQQSNHKPVQGLQKFIQIIHEVPIQLWFAVIALVTSFGFIFCVTFYCKIHKEAKERMSTYGSGKPRRTRSFYFRAKKRANNKSERNDSKQDEDDEKDTNVNRINDGKKKSSTKTKTKKKMKEPIKSIRFSARNNLSSSHKVDETRGDKDEREEKGNKSDNTDNEDEGSILYDESEIILDIENDILYASEEENDRNITTNKSQHDEEGDITLSELRDEANDEWIKHLDVSSGNNYYENTRTRRVTWTIPASMSMVEAKEVEGEEERDMEQKEEEGREEDIAVEPHQKTLVRGEGETDEWIEHLDASSGDKYYENSRTRRVTWTKPTSSHIIEEEPLTEEDEEEEEEEVDRGEEEIVVHEWIQYLDESSGDYYYENISSGEVTWSKPTSPFISYEDYCS